MLLEVEAGIDGNIILRKRCYSHVEILFCGNKEKFVIFLSSLVENMGKAIYYITITMEDGIKQNAVPCVSNSVLDFIKAHMGEVPEQTPLITPAEPVNRWKCSLI